MEKPVLCFDLDGTLVNERGEIHPQDLLLLTQEPAPAVFIPCTGRLRHAVRGLFNRHNLYREHKLPFPMLLQNGSSLYGWNEQVLAYHPFPISIRQFFLDLILSTPEVTFLIFGEDRVYVQWPTVFSSAMIRRFDLEVELFNPQSGLAFSKVMALCESAEVLARVAKLAQRDGIEQAYSLNLVLEFTPAGINKGNALSSLLNMLGLTNNIVAAAGDGENDLSMFSLTPYTIAPQTAPQQIRAQASHVINVAENGLFLPLLNLIKNR
ncbi:MAG: Cof-type HAD-IIB family hydrolase [Anaerolineae bacterium]|nr:Cof-type HAD-IIB family hydrolase [Anaerolineae bacterium]